MNAIKGSALYRLYRADMPRMKHIAAAILAAVYAAASCGAAAAGSLLLSALCAVLTVALLASVIFAYRRLWLIAAPIAAAAVTLIITRDPVAAMIAVLPFPAASALAVSFFRRRDKGGMITATSVAIGAWGLLTVAVYAACGGAFPSFDEMSESVRRAVMSATVNSASGPAAVFSEQAAAGIAEYVMLSIPAIVIVSIMLVSFLAATIMPHLLRLFSFSDYVYDGALVYRPSTAAAVIYILAYATSVALTFIRNTDAIGYAAENVLLALLPAMLLEGERSIYEFAAAREKRFLFYIANVILLLFSISLFLMLVSFTGAISRVWRAIRPRLDKFIHFHGDDFDDFDDYDDDDGGGYYYDGDHDYPDVGDDDGDGDDDK